MCVYVYVCVCASEVRQTSLGVVACMGLSFLLAASRCCRKAGLMTKQYANVAPHFEFVILRFKVRVAEYDEKCKSVNPFWVAQQNQ